MRQELQQQLLQKQGFLDEANQTIARLRVQRQRHREQLDATPVEVQQNSLQMQIALGAATAQAKAERNINAQLRTELRLVGLSCNKSSRALLRFGLWLIRRQHMLLRQGKELSCRQRLTPL